MPESTLRVHVLTSSSVRVFPLLMHFWWECRSFWPYSLCEYLILSSSHKRCCCCCFCCVQSFDICVPTHFPIHSFGNCRTIWARKVAYIWPVLHTSHFTAKSNISKNGATLKTVYLLLLHFTKNFDAIFTKATYERMRVKRTRRKKSTTSADICLTYFNTRRKMTSGMRGTEREP